MTTELEKQFFDTFGVEPRDNFKGCKSGITFYTYGCNMPSCKGCSKEIREKEYPPITDRILLELICLNNRHYVTLEDLICPKNIETIKESVLKKYIKRNKEFVDNGYSGFYLKQVQALFKE